MNGTLRLLAVLAHPDDESLGLGGTLARYAADPDVETYLVTATRGERGRFFDNTNRPTDAEVGRAREQELRAAAAELGVRGVALLDYLDGELDRVHATQAIDRIVVELRRCRPHVVVTFGPDGAYGHPDHIAVSQFTTAAVVAAADPEWEATAPDAAPDAVADAMAATASHPAPPHRVAKLYYLAMSPKAWALYQSVFKRLVSTVDGVEREATAWPEWSLTTRIDATEHWEAVWRAVRRHETQLAVYQGLDALTPEQHRELWGEQHFYRAFSLVNGGRSLETDLFAGLRPSPGATHA
jgi:LmbE family N-acetylglucosaminyl deacetylase